MPFIQKIFEAEGIDSFYKNTVSNYTASLSFIYYPYIQSTTLERKLKAHKDFVLITVLYITKPVLSLYVNENWYAIDPKPGYVVVNIGNSLEIMTGHTYNSSLHRVHPPIDQDRLSISLFFGPNFDIPICNYKTGEQHYKNFQSLLEEQAKIVYPGTFDE